MSIQDYRSVHEIDVASKGNCIEYLLERRFSLDDSIIILQECKFVKQGAFIFNIYGYWFSSGLSFPRRYFACHIVFMKKVESVHHRRNVHMYEDN